MDLFDERLENIKDVPDEGCCVVEILIVGIPRLVMCYASLIGTFWLCKTVGETFISTDGYFINTTSIRAVQETPVNALVSLLLFEEVMCARNKIALMIDIHIG